MFLIAGQSIPRGGQITVDPVGEGDAHGLQDFSDWRLCQGAAGRAGFAGKAAPMTVRSMHMLCSYYTGLLAKDCGLAVTATSENDVILIATH